MNISDFWTPYRGAVSLTFDDGTLNQIEEAFPLLDRYGIKGTDYIHPYGKDWKKRCGPWAEIASNGHEIGNHTVSHYCSRNLPGVNKGIEDISINEIRDDILLAQERLEQIAPHQKNWTFAYPCGVTHVGMGKNKESYIPVIAENFLAGRICGEYGYGNDPSVADLSCVWGIPVERRTGYEMIGLVEELTSQGMWVVLVFHEINGERLTVGSYEFNMLLNYLARKSDKIWTATVAEVSAKIKTI